MADFDIPELPAAGPGADFRSAWRVDRREGRAPRRSGRRWYHHWELPDGRRWVAFARDPAGYVLRFPDHGDFEVQLGERVIHCYADNDEPAHTLRHLLLDQVLPLLAGTTGRLALHGSVVGVDGGALVFLGQAGQGKSTLAWRLGRAGHPVLSDDCCVIERRSGLFQVVPWYPGVRLKPDAAEGHFGPLAPAARVAAYSTKVRVSEPEGLRYDAQPVPVRRIYLMAPQQPGDAARPVAITPRSATESALDLVAHTFHLDIEHGPRLREAFDLAADVARVHETRSLEYSWDLAAVDAVAAAVLADRP